MRGWFNSVLVVCLLLAGMPGLAQDSDPLAAQDPALVQAARTGDPQAAVDLGLAMAQSGREADILAAKPWVEQAYRDAKALVPPDPRLAGVAALVLGRIHTGLSKPRAALDLATEALQQFEAVVATPEGKVYNYLVAAALEDQASALHDLERYRESLPMIAKARAIHEAADPVNNLSLALNWAYEGGALTGAGDQDGALLAFGKAIDLYRAETGDETFEIGMIANNIGWIKVIQKDYAAARSWLDLSYEIIIKLDGSFSQQVTVIQTNLGLAALGELKYDEAIDWGMKSMPYMIANRSQTLDDQRWIFELLSHGFAAKGDVSRAIFFGKMAVNAHQEFRASNTMAGGADVADSHRKWGRLYSELADLMISEGRISEAQAVLNMAKEEEVFQFLKRDASAKLTETRAILTDAELGDEAKLAALAEAPVAAELALQALMVKVTAGAATAEEEDQLFLLQDALQLVTDEFDAAVADFLAASAPDQQAGFDAEFDAVGSYQAVLAGLPRPTAILQVAALDHATHLFLTLPGVTVHEEVAIDSADLARMVFEALDAVASVTPDAKDKLAVLENVLFAPVDQALRDAGIEVIMLNLDGFLRYVPFAALHDGQGYLVERYAFSLYSTAVPTQFDRATRAPDATAGFGVTQAHPGFAALPGVATELDTIFGVSKGVLTGETALDAGFDERSLKKVLLHKPGILHIASHFNLVPGREDDSFLLLGDGSHLPLSKIRATRALRFQGVDLLTLSACQTARGGDGSEIDGFGATAQLNGAAAVMASLWPVSDAATPRLMRDFYQAMMVDGLDKAESLRRAQLAMLQRGGTVELAPPRQATALDDAAPKPNIGFDHPYFWSAFVLMGNWL